MICRIVRMFLPLYVENDLPVSMASRVSRHLGYCNSCLSEHQSFIASQRTARQAALTEPAPAPSERLGERIHHDILKASSHPGVVNGQANGRHHWQRVVTWSAAAVLLIGAIGLLIRSGGENADSQLARSSERNSESLIYPYGREYRESRRTSRAEIKALMRRLNPRPYLTDEELDAEYPVLVSVNQPDGVPVIYRTNDSNTTIVWLLPRKGANRQ
ncbi:MAG: hypothetical protein OYM47_13955 [Gemmatimonadota bacterium]|nr:hypothetical protein [Gemmatimonadota bacterium]